MLQQNKFNFLYPTPSAILGDKASEYEFTNSVKAVTYNEMLVENEQEPDPRNQKKKLDMWKIQVVLDV